MPEPYDLADRAQAQLNKAALRKTEQTKQRLIIEGFDELNVLRLVDALYEDLDRQNRKKYKELFVARYSEVMLSVGETPNKDELDELLDIHLAGLFEEPNEATQYTYSTEVLRKRDRAKEAILSVPTKAQKQLQLDKHVRYFLQMTGWYTDFVSQDAEITAYKDAGIKKVQRHERDDAKTCSVCRAADGDIYPINKIPPIPHLRCRRWFNPV